MVSPHLPWKFHANRSSRFAWIQNVTDDRQTDRQTDRRHSVPKARLIVRSAKKEQKESISSSMKNPRNGPTPTNAVRFCGEITTWVGQNKRDHSAFSRISWKLPNIFTCCFANVKASVYLTFLLTQGLMMLFYTVAPCLHLAKVEQ